MKTYFFYFLTLLLFASCSKSDSPEKIGESIYLKYADFIKEVGKILEKKQDVPATCNALDELAEKYKKELVEIGKKREALPVEDRKKADRATIDKAYELYLTKTPEYEAFSNYIDAIRSENADCSNKLSEYTIISQYGNFDLLRKQSPDEAKRFGVE